MAKAAIRLGLTRDDIGGEKRRKSALRVAQSERVGQRGVKRQSEPTGRVSQSGVPEEGGWQSVNADIERG